MPTAQSDFSVADVLAWARTKPADLSYDYQDGTNCALCQFLADTGRAQEPRVSAVLFGRAIWFDRNAVRSPSHEYPVALDEAVAGENGINLEASSEWTFGGLVKRLEALCPDTPVSATDWRAIDAYLTDIEQVSA